MTYHKGDLIYEGKGKKVHRVANNPDLLWLDFKDSLTAFNAQKLGSFPNKGAIGRDITSIVIRFLEMHEISSHRVQDIGEHEMICKKLEMIPLEVVVRNVVAGSFAKKFNLPEGEVLKKPIVEFFYKKDELGDPFISDEHALYLNAVRSPSDLEQLKRLALKINSALKNLFESIGIRLVDFKLEFGYTSDGEIVLGDEITPDSCRLWDFATNEKLDKDRFRRDLGGVADGYSEVLKRLREKEQV